MKFFIFLLIKQKKYVKIKEKVGDKDEKKIFRTIARLEKKKH